MFWVSLVTQTVKNLLAMQETLVQFLGREDSLEKGKATHSSILAWRIPETEEPGGLQFMGSALGMDLCIAAGLPEPTEIWGAFLCSHSLAWAPLCVLGLLCWLRQ